jgi:hypothetical protein
MQTAQQSQNRKRKRKQIIIPRRRMMYRGSSCFRYSVRLIYPKIKNSASHPLSLSLSLTCHRLTDIRFVLVVVTRIGWDMDPFVVISFGKKLFRTRVIRHSLNPLWDEKLLFHVRAYESAFKVQLTALDWNKLSSNDYVGDAGFMVADLMADRDENTGLYGEEADGGRRTKEFKVPLLSSSGKGAVPREAKHNPVITFR